MEFPKRAFLSITRRKGKALILFAVIFILGNLIAGAISIQQATGNVEQAIKKKLGSVSTIEIDQKAIEKAMTEGTEIDFEPLDSKLLKKIGESDYVKYYDFNLNIYVGGDSVKPYKSSKDKNEGTMSMSMSGMEFQLKGVQYAPVLDFKEKKAKLIEGRTFTEKEINSGDNVTIISKKLAEENNLSVGDSFSLKNNVFDFSKQVTDESEALASRDVPLKVIGIFEPIELKKSEQSADKSEPQTDFFNTQYQNTLYVPNEMANKENTYNQQELAKTNPEMAERMKPSFSPTYVLKNPEVNDAFKSEAEALIPKNYKLTSSSDQYHSIAAPIKSMSKLSGYVLIAAIGASLLIISLVVLLFLRDRKHEFGIYLSIGESRSKVLGQVIIEVMTVAILAITLSLFTGNILASNLSNSMIQNQFQAEAERKEADEANGGSSMMIASGGFGTGFGENVNQEDVTKEYQVKLTSGYIISFFSIGLVTILISTIAPMIYLIRLNPKKILM